MRSLQCTLTFVSFFCSTWLIAQQKSQVGIYISSWGQDEIALDFRQSVTQKVQFIVGVSAGFDSGKDRIGVAEWNDDVRSFRVRNTVARNVNLKVGATRDIKNGPFYFGLNLMGGAQFDNVYLYNSGTFRNSATNQWMTIGFSDRPTQEVSIDEFTSETVWMQDRWARIGLQGVFGANINFGKRMTLNVFSALYGGTLLLLDREVLLEPEDSNIGQFTPGFPFAYLNLNPSCGAGIRYAIN